MHLEHNIKHLAVIMDGNSRWAKSKGLPEKLGYQRGLKAFKNLIKNSIDLNIKHLSVYAFSYENWGRPKEEIDYLMKLVNNYLIKEGDSFHKNNIKVDIIGDLSKLDSSMRERISNLIEKTKNNTDLFLYVAFSYGGRCEILDACKKIIDQNVQKDCLNINNLSNYLYNSSMPDVDLLIRSGGNKRISNFLLWHIAYAELYFIDKYWPSFTKKDLLYAIKDFIQRKRTFGRRL